MSFYAPFSNLEGPARINSNLPSEIQALPGFAPGQGLGKAGAPPLDTDWAKRVPDASKGTTEGIDRATCLTDKTGSIIAHCLGRAETAPEKAAGLPTFIMIKASGQVLGGGLGKPPRLVSRNASFDGWRCQAFGSAGRNRLPFMRPVFDSSRTNPRRPCFGRHSAARALHRPQRRAISSRFASSFVA